MITRQDYQGWDEDDEDPGQWSRPGSSEAINRKRQLRRKPSNEDRHIRQKNRRTAADEGDQVAMNNRADIVRQIQKAATLQEQLTLVAVLEEFDRDQGLRATASRGQLDLEDTVAGRLDPVRVHEYHTAATEWMGDVDDAPSDWHQRVAAEASVWYQSRTAELKADAEEFSIQANDKARYVAGQYGLKRDAALRTFLDYVSFLHHTGASGLDQVQQTVDGNNQAKTTPLPPEVFDNFAPDVDPVNKGVSGTETSTRNPLLQEILHNGGGGGPEKVNEHDEGNSLSWSPPSGMQKDTAPGFSDGDPGTPEDNDEHNESFKSDSEYSKHTSAYQRTPAIGGNIKTLDDFREQWSAEGKADGHRGGRTASSTPDAGNAADDLFGPEEEEEAKKADPVGGKVARNLTVKQNGSRYQVVDNDSGQAEPGDHHTADAANDHIDYLNNRVKKTRDVHTPGTVGGAGWHQTTRYASGDGFKPHSDAHYVSGDPKPNGNPDKHQYSHGIINGEELTDNAHGNPGPHKDHPLYSEAASGLDMIDQVIDANNQPKVTPNGLGDDPYQVAFPLNDAFKGEKTTNGTGDVSDGNNDEVVKDHHTAVKTEPYYTHSTPDHIVDGSQWAEHRTNQALHTGDMMSHARAATAHADVLNNIYDSGHDDSLLEAHHKGRMNYHEDRAAKLNASHHEAILNKVADMFGGSDAQHQVLLPVANNPLTTPDTPESASKAKGKKDADENKAPTFSDGSSHIPAGAKAYSEGYAEGGKEAPKNEPPSMQAPGKGTTKAGSNDLSWLRHGTRVNTTGGPGVVHGSVRNEAYGPVADVVHDGGAKKSYHVTKIRPEGQSLPQQGNLPMRSAAVEDNHADHKEEVPGCKKCEQQVDDAMRHGASVTDQHAEHKEETPGCKKCAEQADDAMRHGAKASHLITTAADRSQPDFMKGYFYASKWDMSMPLVTEGTSSFEAGLYAGLTDNPHVQPYFVEASRERGMTDRLAQHRIITQSLADQLGVKVAGTSLYLDTTAPNTSPTASDTPINGQGRPGPLDGKETGSEPAGGPSPYNGAEPHGKPVVPGASHLEEAKPTDQLVQDSGYTTPRAVEKASAFRRSVQAGLLREGNR